MIEYKHLESGFMKDPAYAAYFHKALKDYEESFEGADKVIVEIEEKTLWEMEHDDKPWLIVENNVVTIRFSQSRYYDNKGNAIDPPPSAYTVFQNLKNLMKNAVKRFKNKDY